MICCIIICPCCCSKRRRRTTATLDARVQALQTIAQSVARMGVLNLHKLVDAICGRHGLSAKHLPLLRDKGAGATLFDLTSSSFFKAVRRMLTLLGHKGCKQVHFEGVQGWKGHFACGSRLAKRRHLWQQVTGNPLRSSGTARPMISPSLPSSRWCALKTRTELHRWGGKVFVESRRVRMGKSVGGTDMQREVSVGDQCRLLW